jgi:hypothetical protein
LDETRIIEQKGTKQEVTIPFYINIDSLDLIVFYNDFPKVEGNTLVLPRVSNHGVKEDIRE